MNKVIFSVLFSLLFCAGAAQNIGIGTNSPSTKLHVVGDLRFETQARLDSNSDFLSLNESGVASKIGIQGFLNNYTWKTSGNQATSNYFIGTKNAIPFKIVVNSNLAAIFTENGKIGLGTGQPERKLVIFNNDISQNSEVIIRQAAGSPLGAFLTLDNTSNPGGKFWSIGSSGPMNTSGIAGAIGSLEFYQFDAGPTSRVRMIINPNGNVGIATNTPQARLHIIGNMRLETPDRVYENQDFLTASSNGTVSRMGISEFMNRNAWQTRGNNADMADYIGTNNQVPLRLNVNGSNQMLITPEGRIGFGEATPNRKFVISNYNSGENNELVLKQYQGSQYGSFLTLDNSLNPGGKFWSIGSSGQLNTSGVAGAIGSLEFYQFDAGPDNRVRMIINPNGNVGINTLNAQAKLHVDGSVRFSNLTQGSGNVLVINSNGEIFRSTTVVSGAAQVDGGVNAELESLKKEVQILRNEIAVLKASLGIQQ
jgi:hypothetical protein